MHSISPHRRGLLRTLLRFGALALATGLWGRPALAAAWNQAAFDSKNIQDALKAVGITDTRITEDIVIKAPEIAENGAQVPIEIISKIADTERIYVFVDKNPWPYVGSFGISKGIEPFISTRIKMGESSNLRVVVRAGGKFFMALREVKVTIGGCAS
jgi:sulfur-oxidizing protein SoxY